MNEVDQLLEYKKQKRLNNQDLADRLGVDESTVRNWLRGRTFPHRITRRAISQLISEK